mgnify:FL=1
MKRKIYLALVLAGIMVMGLNGCNSSEKAKSDGKANADQQNENSDSGEQLTLSFLRAGTSENVQKVYEELIDAYEKEHPNIKIEYEQIGYGEELETKLNTMYASGMAPDIVRAPISTIAERA